MIEDTIITELKESLLNEQREHRIDKMILDKAMTKIVEQKDLIAKLKQRIVELETKKPVRKQNGGS